MSHLSNGIVAGQPLFSSSSTQYHALGEKFHTKDGRTFRYVLAGASALVVGDVIQSPAQVANHHELTPSAAAIGATQITVTLGSTLATANQYANGWAIIGTTPGLGYAYEISSNPAADSAASLTVTLQQEDAVQVALTSTSRVTLQANPYRSVIQAPVTTLTGIVVGVAIYPITAAQYGWIQTGGVAPTLIAGTPAVGQAVSSPSSAAGAAAINSSTLDVIGKILVTGQDGKVMPVYLTID